MNKEMSETKEMLEEELIKIKSQINGLINQANIKHLPGKTSDIAIFYDEDDNCRSNGYFYCEKNLSISYNNRYVKVNLGYETNDVFRAKLYENGVGEIDLYIPGEWEKRIDDLYTGISSLKEMREKEILRDQISHLRKEWQLEAH